MVVMTCADREEFGELFDDVNKWIQSTIISNSQTGCV